MTSSTLVETVSLNYEDFSESFLTCSTCLCTYDGQERTPKLLSCSHTVCRSCLERLVQATGSQQLRCPICREAVTLPAPGVAALPPSFLVNQLLDLVQGRRREVVPKCVTHPAAPELLFCETCDRVFCSACPGDAHDDSSHTVVPFSIAVKRMSEILLYKAQLCLGKLDAAAEAVSAEMNRLGEAVERATDQVEASFREVQDLLEQRRKSLLGALQGLWERKRATLQEQLDLITAERERLERDCCGTENQLEVRNLTKKIADLDSRMSSLGLLADPRENCYLHYDCSGNNALTDIAEALGSFGRIETSRTFPPLCTLNVPDCPAHLEARVVLRTYDYEGHPQKVGGDPVEVELSDADGASLDVRLTDRGTGEYVIQFRPPCVGRYLLTVSVLGRAIRGSPFEFAAIDDVEPDLVIGRCGISSDDCFLQPVAAVWGPGDSVYVLDTGNCRIRVFSPELCSIGHLTGTGLEERGSTGLASSPSRETLLTCNWKTRHITEFNASGQVLRSFTHADLREPTALAVNSHGDVFVVDSGERCIFIFEHDGKLRKKISCGTPPGGSSPNAIAIAPNDLVLVGDSGIHVFDSEGNHVKDMFLQGRGKGRICGICVDHEGKVLATRSERNKNRLLVFHSVGGELAFTIEGQESRLGRPAGVAVLPGGHALVVDLGNNCIKRYRYQ